MTKYRDLLCETHNEDIGSVVGCGLDRLSREVNSQEIDTAVNFYTNNKAKINEFPIGARRQAVEEYISSGMQIPSYIKT
jgi:hypothetical protein